MLQWLLCVGNSSDLRGPTVAGILLLCIFLFLPLTVASIDLLLLKHSNYYYFLQLSLKEERKNNREGSKRGEHSLHFGITINFCYGATFSKPDDARIEIFLSLETQV